MEKIKNLNTDKNVNWFFILLITVSLTYFGTFIYNWNRPDFDSYARLFQYIGSKNYEIARFENNTINSFGFFYYIKFFRFFSDNFRLFIAITIFLSISIKIFLISKLSRNVYFSTLLYTFLVYPIHELIQIRIGLATSLLFLTIYYLNKNKILSIIIFISSFSIHLVTLPLAIGAYVIKILLSFVKEKKIKLKISSYSLFGLLFIIIISLIRFSSLNTDLGYYFDQRYLDIDLSANLFSIRSSLLLLMIIIGLKEFRNIPETAKNWICISLLGLSSYYIFINNMNVASRLMQSTYFSFIIWINYMPYRSYIFLKYILLVASLIFLYLFIKLN